MKAFENIISIHAKQNSKKAIVKLINSLIYLEFKINTNT